VSIFRAIEVDYDFSQILEADYSAHTGSCIGHQTRELSDIHSMFGGFPESYCLENTVMHQLWWDQSQINYAELGQQLGIDVMSISSIMQPPGNVIPYHRDMFYKLASKYPDRTERPVRANIFLESGKLGHLLQFTLDGKHQMVSDWQTNKGFLFDSDILHLSCNAGMEPKYTLQISGFYLGQEQ